MQEITVKMTGDTLTFIIQALQDSLVLRNQNCSMLINSLQSQAQAQVQPVASTVAQ